MQRHSTPSQPLPSPAQPGRTIRQDLHVRWPVQRHSIPNLALPSLTLRCRAWPKTKTCIYDGRCRGTPHLAEPCRATPYLGAPSRQKLHLRWPMQRRSAPHPAKPSLTGPDRTEPSLTLRCNKSVSRPIQRHSMPSHATPSPAEPSAKTCAYEGPRRGAPCPAGPCLALPLPTTPSHRQKPASTMADAEALLTEPYPAKPDPARPSPGSKICMYDGPCRGTPNLALPRQSSPRRAQPDHEQRATSMTADVEALLAAPNHA